MMIKIDIVLIEKDAGSLLGVKSKEGSEVGSGEDDHVFSSEETNQQQKKEFFQKSSDESSFCKCDDKKNND